jgi:hypothetical protein
MLVDFTVAPASKVDVEDRVERAKDSRNEQQERLHKVAIDARKSNMVEKNERASAPELNRIHVGGVAMKTVSMGWADRTIRSSSAGAGASQPKK